MSSTPSESGRVLIIEDEPALLRALQINLRARGYEVTSSNAGQEALVEAARRPPDAVLLGLGLPAMDGRQVFSLGQITIDLAARTALRRPAGEGEPAAVRLTKTEWRMLEVLLRSPGQLVSSARLLTELWGPGAENSTHYLRFHMAGLRRKLEEAPPRP